MDVGNAPAACSWPSLPEFLRRVAAGKLHLVRSYPVQEEHVTSASLSRRRWRAGVRRDETRVSTIEGSRGAAGPHPIYGPLISWVPAPTFQQVRERHEPGDGLVSEVRPPGAYAGAGVKTPKWLPAGSCKSAKTSRSLLVVGGTSTFPPSRSTWAQTAATSGTTSMKIAWFGNSPPVSKIPPLGASAPG